MKQILSHTAAAFHSGTFSFVMATGIVSLAVFQHRMETIAYLLFGVNTIAYAALAAVMIIRGAFFPSKLLADMTAPSRAPALFTITAGTCILVASFSGFRLAFIRPQLCIFCRGNREEQ
jgi:tellurite resistance protein TehA-like permease